jgi:hypothetical protein
MGEIINAYKIWSVNMYGKELGRPRRRWEVNIRMDLVEIRWRKFGLDAFGSG